MRRRPSRWRYTTSPAPVFPFVTVNVTGRLTHVGHDFGDHSGDGTAGTGGPSGSPAHGNTSAEMSHVEYRNVATRSSLGSPSWPWSSCTSTSPRPSYVKSVRVS